MHHFATVKINVAGRGPSGELRGRPLGPTSDPPRPPRTQQIQKSGISLLILLRESTKQHHRGRFWTKSYREVSVNRNTPQKHRLSNRAGRVGNPAGNPRETTKNNKKTTETQGPCPDRRGFCISAPTVRVPLNA